MLEGVPLDTLRDVDILSRPKQYLAALGKKPFWPDAVLKRQQNEHE